MGGYGMKNYVKESSFSDDLKLLGYREGKKEIIAKACEWLDKVNTDNYMDSGIFQMSALITDFKKAMKGEL